jgi:hypothetical protein
LRANAWFAGVLLALALTACVPAPAERPAVTIELGVAAPASNLLSWAEEYARTHKMKFASNTFPSEEMGADHIFQLYGAGKHIIGSSKVLDEGTSGLPRFDAHRYDVHVYRTRGKTEPSDFELRKEAERFTEFIGKRDAGTSVPN